MSPDPDRARRRASTSARPTSSTSAGPSRAASPAAPTRSSRRARASSWPTPRMASRKDARDAVVAARDAFGRLVRRHGVQPRSDPLPGRRDAGGPAGPVRRRGRAPREGAARRAGPETLVDAGDRPLGLVRRLGGQDRPGARRREPGRRAVLQPLRARADRRGRASWRRRTSVPARPGQRASRRSIVTGNTVVVARQRGPAAAGDHAGRGAGHLRPARRRGQPAHRPGGGDRRPGSPRTCDVNAIDLAGVGRRRRARRPTLELAAADNLKRVLRPPASADAAEPDWTPTPDLAADAGRSSRRRRSGTPRAAEVACERRARAAASPQVQPRPDAPECPNLDAPKSNPGSAVRPVEGSRLPGSSIRGLQDGAVGTRIVPVDNGFRVPGGCRWSPLE